MKKRIENADFESIIPTALHTAYPLIFTDIPYSQEIYNGLLKYGFDEKLKNEKLVFELEARHKLIDKFVLESGINQILEMASGFTGNGLAICQNNENIKYVEFDLPQVIKKKQEILKSFTTIPNNMFFVEGNALRYGDIERAFKYFDLTKPIAVINQGLLRYLNFEEKQIVTENVYKVISKANGIWVTCDFTPAKFIQAQDKQVSSKESSNYNEELKKITDRNNVSWRFKDKNDVEMFLGKNNLKIEWHDFTESIPLLSSKIKYGLTDEEIVPYLKNAYVSIIDLKDNV